MSLWDAFDRMFKWERDFFSNFDKEFDKVFDRLKGSKEIEGKGYSLSYHYETGMDEPEITVKGNIDQETLDRFLDSVKKRFGEELPGIKAPKVNLLKPVEEKEEE